MKRISFKVSVDTDEFEEFCGDHMEYLPQTEFDATYIDGRWECYSSAMDETFFAETIEELAKKIEEFLNSDEVVTDVKLVKIESV